jgi:hypothetical protein
MKFLEIIEPILKFTAISAISVYTTKVFVTGYMIANRKSKLNQTNSKISALKLKLKSRVNQKLNTLDSIILNSSSVTLKNIISDIRAIEFNNSEDYENLISKITEIVVTIRSERSLNSTAPEPESDDTPKDISDSISPELDLIRQNCQDVFEFDNGVVIIVIEIKHLTDFYIKLAKDFNQFIDKKKKEDKLKFIPEPISIENLHVLEEIYNRQKSNLEGVKLTEVSSEDEKPENENLEKKIA